MTTYQIDKDLQISELYDQNTGIYWYSQRNQKQQYRHLVIIHQDSGYLYSEQSDFLTLKYIIDVSRPKNLVEYYISRFAQLIRFLIPEESIRAVTCSFGFAFIVVLYTRLLFNFLIFLGFDFEFRDFTLHIVFCMFWGIFLIPTINFFAKYFFFERYLRSIRFVADYFIPENAFH